MSTGALSQTPLDQLRALFRPFSWFYSRKGIKERRKGKKMTEKEKEKGRQRKGRAMRIGLGEWLLGRSAAGVVGTERCN